MLLQICLLVVFSRCSFNYVLKKKMPNTSTHKTRTASTHKSRAEAIVIEMNSMKKEKKKSIQLEVNVVLSEFVIINLYVLLKYFCDTRFAGDFIRSPCDVEARLDRSCHTCLYHCCLFVISFCCKICIK